MSAASEASKFVTVGKIAAVFGVKGWLKVTSFTDPPENVLNYTHWHLKFGNGSEKTVEIDQGKSHGNGFIVHVVGFDDRDLAKALTLSEIRVESAELPQLNDGEFYWHQLEGLQVYRVDEPEHSLGQVVGLLETGANDVLVIKELSGAEMLVPYLPDQVVKRIDLVANTIEIDWTPPE